MRGHVLPRQAGDDPGLDAEEGADPVERLRRTVDQGEVAQHQHLLAGEHAVQVLQLLAVPQSVLVPPTQSLPLMLKLLLVAGVSAGLLVAVNV